ncbi:hypothetical protein BU23DRAFT_596608 [Bimuria novae-zelandiae CBS 107.79]|uniref:Dynamin stalk domain-containing protein n=1 Tax=Bimuria novae-zelandiae CBS 107.79 TaxID=1447943 RepID=A0A6A5VHP4_9PLEO|nr:hypothetical protein BU23DRAFT_596608 [Bimuria novae-zelandiae CBS 107.79]
MTMLRTGILLATFVVTAVSIGLIGRILGEGNAKTGILTLSCGSRAQGRTYAGGPSFYTVHASLAALSQSSPIKTPVTDHDVAVRHQPRSACRLKCITVLPTSGEWDTPLEIREQRAAELKAQGEFEGQTYDTGSDDTKIGATDTEVSLRNPVTAPDQTWRARKRQKSCHIGWLPSPPPSADSSLDISCTRKRRRTSEGENKDAERFAGENVSSKEGAFPARETAFHNASQQKNWKRRRVLEAGDTEVINVGRSSSQNESDWIELAQNKNIYFKVGWHMLRNRADTEMNFTFAQRNEAETIFFSKGRYKDLIRENVGIDSLRLRLSQLLLDHLKKELPSLKDEMTTKLQATIHDIQRLGEKRTTIDEQHIMLMKVSMRINDLIKCALEGHYRDIFFGSSDMDIPVDSGRNLRQFRAVVQYLNTQFADDMRF